MARPLIFLILGAEKNKGLAYYRYMFCAENRQILAIVDWPLIGVDRLQRCSARMTYKVVLKFVATYHSSVFEWCQHQLVANQQSPKSGDSLHKTCNGSTPDPYFSPPPYQKKNKRSGHARLTQLFSTKNASKNGIFLDKETRLQ